MIARILQGLRKQEIWCIAKDYNIDGFLDPNEINKRLIFVNTDDVRKRNNDLEEIDFSQYPVINAKDNYMNFLYDEMCRERKLVKQCYYD